MIQDWDIILEEIYNKEYPLQELKIEWSNSSHEPIDSSYLELAKIIGSHTTLIKIDCCIRSFVLDNALTVLFEGLGDNRSIRHLRLECQSFSTDMAKVFTQTLMNNTILRSLDIKIYAFPAYDHMGEYE